MRILRDFEKNHIEYQKRIDNEINKETLKFLHDLRNNPKWLKMWKRFELMKSYIIKACPRRLLDVGCQDGVFTISLKDIVTKEVVGLDSGEYWIKRAILENKSDIIKFTVGYIEKTNFTNGYFDYIVAGSVLEHVVDIDKAFKEISRITCLGGQLLITLPIEEVGRENKYHLRQFDPEDIFGFCRLNSFKVDKFESHKTFNLYIARKIL